MQNLGISNDPEKQTIVNTAPADFDDREKKSLAG